MDENDEHMQREELVSQQNQDYRNGLEIDREKVFESLLYD